MNNRNNKEIKCVIWDLDNTMWDGILAESDQVTLKPGIIDIIKVLDERGILQSVASKNDFKQAMQKLREFGLHDYFLYPEIHWNPKSESVLNIQRNLNINADTILFIDDQPFERDEVVSVVAGVETMKAEDYTCMLSRKRLCPRFITEDSKRRRLMYQEDILRNDEEAEFRGPKEEFLASLNMQFTIGEARYEDLERAEELTIRTNQLNATGRTYDFNELQAIIRSDKHKLYVCELSDKYGSYGKIGLALIEIDNAYVTLRMMLMSCRVISRSVGSVLLSFIMEQTKNAGKTLRADFRTTDLNKKMYAAYRFANFREVANDGKGNITFENDLTIIPKYPHYMDIRFPSAVETLN